MASLKFFQTRVLLLSPPDVLHGWPDGKSQLSQEPPEPTRLLQIDRIPYFLTCVFKYTYI